VPLVVLRAMSKKEGLVMAERGMISADAHVIEPHNL
jgi:hypothetical protein